MGADHREGTLQPGCGLAAVRRERPGVEARDGAVRWGRVEGVPKESQTVVISLTFALTVSFLVVVPSGPIAVSR
ncbi:hypothetical protein GCM10010168_70690 [Actinoplanes ianthinogenes]|nr:hypothetical protein GCM10010168_70690 [Actinoplanes ianthinogenes]